MIKNSTIRKIKDNLFAYSLLLFPIIAFLVFWVSVNIFTIFMGLFKQVEGQTVFTLEYIMRIFTSFKEPDSLLVEALINTLITFSFSVFFMLPFTLVVAFFIYKKVALSKIYRYVFFLPSIISAVIMTMVYKYFLAPYGPLNAVLSAILGREVVIDYLSDSRYAMGAVLVYMLWTGLAANLIIMSSTMDRIPTEVFEAAKIDGVTPRIEITKIVLPLIWPTISTLLILQISGLFSASGPILLLTQGDAGTFTLDYWIYVQVTSLNQPEFTSAIGLITTLIGTVLVLVARRICDKIEAVEY